MSSCFEKITKLKISDKESEYLFTMFDANRDGFIDIEGELKINSIDDLL